MIALTTVPTTRPRVAGDARLEAKGGICCVKDALIPTASPPSNSIVAFGAVAITNKDTTTAPSCNKISCLTIKTISEGHQEKQPKRIPADCRCGNQAESGRATVRAKCR